MRNLSLQKEIPLPKEICKKMFKNKKNCKKINDILMFRKTCETARNVKRKFVVKQCKT
jgi:hypothetical protein